MKKIYYFILSLILLSSSCTRDDLGTEEQITEGEPVRISVNIDDASLTRTGLSPSQEKTINNVFVMVFDKTGTKVSQSYFSSNITSSLRNITTRSGNNMSVYVVANLSQQNTSLSDISSYFNTIYTVSELNQVMLYDLADDLNVNRDLVMCGSATGLTIPPVGTQNVTVQLNYTVAKVTLYVVTSLTTKADSYNLTNWTVTNYPQKSYLFPQATDAGTSSTDFANSTTSISWVDTTLVISGVSTPAKYAFVYMYENRKGTNSNTTESQKAGNAPANATAIVLRGYYKTASTNTVTGVTTTIYLGNNGINDYNVKRGNEYAHIATVKGIGQVNVDTRVVSNMYGYQVNMYNTTLDCHADWRPLQINSWPGLATINITNTDGTACTWLKVSTKNLNQAVNNARVTYDPATDMVSTLALTYPDSSSIASQTVYVYADENLSPTSRSANIAVTSTAGLTNSQIITIPVTQYGYQTMGSSVGLRTYSTAGAVNTGATADYTLILENIEEATLNLTPGAAAGTEATSSMQWGFNQTVAEPTSGINSSYYFRNGFESTLGLVFSSGTGALGSTLRTPYGRASASSSSSASVKITENTMNPIFNTYGARYCFEKNRDLDGDGQITNPNTKGVNEINWYLPSADDLNNMYIGMSALSRGLTATYYLSSSETWGSGSFTNSVNFNYGLGYTYSKWYAAQVRCVRRIYQTLATGVQNSPYVESGTRNVNNNGFASKVLRTSNVSCPTPSTANNAISPRFQVAKADCQLYGATGGTTMTWSQAAGWNTASDNGSAPVVASPVTGCNAYTEVAGDVGTWRLPTQREMYILILLRKELVATGYTPMSAIYYWTSDIWSGTYGWVGSTTTYALVYAPKTYLYYARCIKDL